MITRPDTSGIDGSTRQTQVYKTEITENSLCKSKHCKSFGNCEIFAKEYSFLGGKFKTKFQCISK